jgi:two-component system sensor histidine kinase KdpD
VAADLPPLEIDPTLIAQALANVLENAVRHSPPDAEILVEVTRRRGLADEIEIAVSDSGPGVPPDQREQIFDLFHRGADGGRAGLGLAIAKAFIEANGGRIGVGAARGGGARFMLTAPAASFSAAELPADDEVSP